MSDAARTALITGASSGIGLELARCFARDRYALVITGRDASTLEAAAATLPREGAEVTTLVAELGTEAGITALLGELERRQFVIDVLVNNAGFGVHGNAVQTAAERELELVSVHVTAPLRLTKALLPGMVRRNRGGILNVGSVYSFSSAPWQAVYGASKSWILSYSLALREELRGSNVNVTALCPGTTLSRFRTRMGQRDRASWLTLTSEQVARAGYAGFARGQALVVPGGWNRLYVFTARHLPARWVSRFVYYTAYRLRGMPVAPITP